MFFKCFITVNMGVRFFADAPCIYERCQSDFALPGSVGEHAEPWAAAEARFGQEGGRQAVVEGPAEGVGRRVGLYPARHLWGEEGGGYFSNFTTGSLKDFRDIFERDDSL